MKVLIKCRCITEFTTELDSDNYPHPHDQDAMIACELEFFQNNSDNYFEIASTADDCKYSFEVIRA